MLPNAQGDLITVIKGAGPGSYAECAGDPTRFGRSPDPGHYFPLELGWWPCGGVPSVSRPRTSPVGGTYPQVISVMAEAN